MTTDERREYLIKILSDSEKPVKGTDLAKELDVSRQAIVQDIAILRARGVDILATPIGYMIAKYESGKIFKTLVTKHFEIENAEEELMIMVDNGAKVIDVVVNHPIYGDMRGVLNLSCRLDVDNFIKSVKDGKVEFLSSLTDGVHIHTIEVENEESFIRIKNKLKEKGYLAEEE